MIKLDSTQVHKSYFDYTTYLEEFTGTTDHLKITILMFSFFQAVYYLMAEMVFQNTTGCKWIHGLLICRAWHRREKLVRQVDAITGIT